MRILRLLFIALASLFVSCQEESKGGRTFKIGEESQKISGESTLDEKTIKEIDSLNLGLVDSIKVGPTVEVK